MNNRAIKCLSSKNSVVTIVTILFACVSLVGLLAHEIWLDEAHHWLLARDSSSLQELWKNTRYEGHPILWNIVLFGITRFTANPIWMQLIHWAISVWVVLFFMRFSPMPIAWSILFVFGYFTLYEYTIISRNYSILTLTFFFAIYFYTSQKYTAWGLSLFLLANTHLFGLIIAGWFIIAAVRDDKNKLRDRRLSFLRAIGVVTIGMVISAAQIFPPGDSPFHPKVDALLSSVSVEKLLAVQIRAFLPIPDLANDQVWNSNWLTAVSRPLAGVMSLSLALAIFGIAFQRISTAILFVGVHVSISLIITLLYPSAIAQGTRHFGVVYIAFIGCLWLALDTFATSLSPKISFRTINWIVCLLLSVQVISGLLMLYLDIKRPFSEGKNVVAFLERENHLDKMIATIDGPIPSISCYLEKKTFSLSAARYESYYNWNQISEQTSLDSVTSLIGKRFSAKSVADFILITHSPLPMRYKSIVLLKTFSGAIVKVENYYVYKVTLSDND